MFRPWRRGNIMSQKTIDNSNSYFVFRESKTADELHSLLKLRYRVFCRSPLTSFDQPNGRGIDLDCWDLRARHFGLFRTKDGTSEAVGYMRVVEAASTSSSDMVRSVARCYTGLLDEVDIQAPHPFPLMKYFPDHDLIGDRYNEILKKGERLVEPGRFALTESVRSRHLGKHMIESAIAVYFFALGFEHATMCCYSSQKPFYRRYGFEPLEGGSESDFAGINRKNCCVFGSVDTIPYRVERRLRQMAAKYMRTSKISYNPVLTDRNCTLKRTTTCSNCRISGAA